MRACMQCYACSRGPAVAHVVCIDRPAQQQPRPTTSHHCCSPRSTPAGRVRAASRPAAANRRAAQLSGVRAAPRRERFRRPHPEHRPAPRPRARSRPLKRGPVLLGACYLNPLPTPVSRMIPGPRPPGQPPPTARNDFSSQTKATSPQRSGCSPRPKPPFARVGRARASVSVPVRVPYSPPRRSGRGGTPIPIDV